MLYIPSTSGSIRALPHRLLGKEEELELILKAQDGDMKASDELIKCNVKLILKIAYQYANGKNRIEDKFQWGAIGLVKAIKRFDTSSDFRLSTYGTLWIKQEIQRRDEMGEFSQSANHPVQIGKAMIKLHRLIGRNLCSRTASAEEFYEAHKKECVTRGVKVESFHVIEKTLEYMKSNEFLSLDVQITDDDGRPYSVLDMGDDNSDSESDAVNSSVNSALYEAMKSVLSSTEHLVLCQRYGIGSGVDNTLSRIADQLNVSQERVRQIQRSAENKLKSRMERSGMGAEVLLHT